MKFIYYFLVFSILVPINISLAVEDELDDIKPTSTFMKEEVDKLGTDIKNIIPDSVTKETNNFLEKVDLFRIKYLNKAQIEQEGTKEYLNEREENPKDYELESSVDKPIKQIKLFLLSIAVFILSSKILFYIVSVFLILYILRFIYRRF